MVYSEQVGKYRQFDFKNGERTNLYIIISLLFIISFLNGTAISEKQVIKVANNFISERFNSFERTINNIYLDGLENIQHFYIVELAPIGFLLISANSSILTVPIVDVPKIVPIFSTALAEALSPSW